MIWLMMACNGKESGPWTRDAALTSTAALGGEAALSEADYTQRSYAAVPFASADTDKSGALSTGELAVLIEGPDPLTFDRARPMGALKPEVWSHPFSEPALQRSMWELLAFLCAEVEAVNPEADLPDADLLRSAAATEDLYSKPVQSVLDMIKVQYEANGLTFPDGLIHAP